jgi:hypothetical protein
VRSADTAYPLRPLAVSSATVNTCTRWGVYVQIEIPRIEQFPDGFPNFWAKLLFVASIPAPFQVRCLATTYIRLTESALIEYRLGSGSINEFWNDTTSFGLSAMHRACSQFETCVTNAHRAIQCFIRLYRHRELPGSLRLTLNQDRPKFVSDAVTNQLRRIRDHIQHFEGQLLDREGISEGDDIALRADGPEIPHPTETSQTIKRIDRLSLGKREILFSDLSEWLTEMGTFAEKIAGYEVSQPILDR